MAVLDLNRWIDDLVGRGQRIEREAEVEALCIYVRSLLLEEANCVEVKSPVVICGDIHGQFADLVKLFRIAGTPKDSQFIFLGDYVDRGRDSVEVIELLLCYKALYPSRITLLRGNHESRQITQVYGFYDECLWKYGSATVWKACCAVFDCLNVAAVVDGTVLCVHGGLSPQVRSLEQIATIERAIELPSQGALCDLLWSDPADETDEDWQISNRGAGYLFGPGVAEEFLRNNDLSLICRAHQLVMDGYKYHFDQKNVVTVWSAPNYCGRCGNVASFLRIEPECVQRFVTFSAERRPDEAERYFAVQDPYDDDFKRKRKPPPNARIEIDPSLALVDLFGEPDEP